MIPTFKIVQQALQFGSSGADMNPPIINYYWNVSLPDYVRKVCTDESNFISDCFWGTEDVQGIKVVWILFGYNVPMVINTQPFLWSYHVITPKYLIKNKDIHKCIDWLCKQEELNLSLPYHPINTACIPMLKGYRFKLFQDAVAKISLQSSLDFNSSIISTDEIYNALTEKMRTLAQDKTQKMLSRYRDISSMHLHTLKCYLDKVYFDISSEQQRTIYRLLAEDAIAECKQIIDDFVAQKQYLSFAELNSYLTTRGTDTWDDFLRDYSFLFLSQRVSQHLGHNNNTMPLGLNDEGNWNCQVIPENKDSFSLILHNANQYRYLLNDVWNKVISPNDVLIGVSEKLLSTMVAKTPSSEVFQEIENILRLAVLERQYGIVQPSAIIIGQLGLDKIIFYPTTDTTKCKFKIVTYTNLPKGTNQVLVGKLDALGRKLEFVGANTDNPVIQNYLQMLLLIVAIAYRDLLVCRGVIKQQGKPIDASDCNTKSARQRKIETIRYLPRIKREIDKTFADPTRFVQTLKKVAPHIRTEHFRKLPSGYKPSDKARELAALYGYLGSFPEGETFVSPSTIGEGKLEEIRASVAQFRSLSLLELFFSEG